MAPRKTNKPAGPFGPMSPNARHIGGNSFPDGVPVCEPCAPMRRPKPLSGPIHPGFPKADSRYAGKKPAKFKKSHVISTTGPRTSEQTYDVYKPTRKSMSTNKKRSAAKRKKY